MKSVFSALCLLLTMCSVCAGASSAQLDKLPESLQSPRAHGQKNMEPRYANITLNQWVAYEPRQDMPQDLAAFNKHERIRKTISAIGVTILIPIAMFLSILGGGAFSKTLSSEERKKSIKWIVIAVILMVLASNWNSLVIKAMTLLSG